MNGKPPGVANVVPFLAHLGGTEGLATSLARRFVTEEIPVLMMTCVHLRERNAPRREAPDGVEVIRIPVLQRPPLLDLTWTVPGGIALALKRKRFKAMIAYHLPTAGVLASVTSQITGLPFAAVTQGSGPTGDVTALNALPWSRQRVNRINQAGFVAAINGLIEQELIDSGVRKELIRRVPSACDIHRFEPPTEDQRNAARERFGVSPDQFAIIFTGRLHPDKSLPTLFAAAAGMKDHDRVRLLLTGEGPERSALDAKVKELGLESRTSFLGRLDDHRPALHAGDLFCLPPVSEGISVALLEAMASGLPVLVSDIPGNREVVTDGTDGIIATTGDEDAWRAALERLAGDAPLRRQLAQAGRNTVERRFSKEEIEGLFVEWFRSRVE